MTNFLKRGFYFIKKNPSILYSVFLIVLIPLAFYWNIFFTINSFQKNINFNLQTKALIVENIFAVFSSDISDIEILQEKIVKIVKENPEIIKLQIIVPEKENKFAIIASQDSQEVGKEISDTSLVLAWHQNQPIAYLGAERGERVWDVIRPIYDSEGNKVSLVDISMSLENVDALVSRSIRNSYIILIISIALILFLVIQHTRLFSYVFLSKKLQEIDEMKDNFIRMAIHEIQGPILNIRIYIEALRKQIGVFEKETQAKYFSRIEFSAARLSELVNDMAKVSKIEQGRLSLIPEKVPAQDTVKEVIEELRLKAQNKNLQLFFEEKTEPAFIFVNSNRFKEILYNLIDNSIKYTPKGKVEVKTEIDEIKNDYYITVQDTGLGISAEEQKKLFQKFYRARSKETVDIPGTGLGLWIVKELCTKMGGNILVESMKGVGSKFTIIFPLKK